MYKNEILSHCLKSKLTTYLKSIDTEITGDLHKICIQEVERLLLENVLNFTNQNYSKAAKILGINRTTVKKKVNLYNL